MTITDLISVATISAGAALFTSSLIKRLWRGKGEPCRKCGKHASTSRDEEGRKVVKCVHCQTTIVEHPPAEATSTRSCPKCSGHITLSLKDTTYTWTCQGFPDRDSIVKVRGERMTPHWLTQIPPCGWTGKDSEYGKTWA